MLQRDEATRDRVRQAIEFLDPRTNFFVPLPAPCCIDYKSSTSLLPLESRADRDLGCR
jgi:hypothetical protein